MNISLFQFQWMVDGAFAVFAIVFAVSRLYLYPFYAIYSLVTIWLYNGYCVSYQVVPFLFFLLTLQALHIFWFKTIAQMVFALQAKYWYRSTDDALRSTLL